jgi:hypothetical protein
MLSMKKTAALQFLTQIVAFIPLNATRTQSMSQLFQGLKITD